MKPSQRKSGGDGPGHPQREQQQQRPKRKRGRPRKTPSNPIAAATSPAASVEAPSPKRKKRGRPPRDDRAASGPKAEDVLTLRGAAAQQTIHPGNLRFYALCESRYDEYAALPDRHPRRRSICQEIVDEIHRSGGTFRKESGGTMDAAKACDKAKDRMRQIAKPKIVPPPNVGNDDVVFKIGATNHLFPGNARWRALLDGYVTRYWPDPHGDGRRKRRKVWKEPRQTEIIEEVISIVRGRGGQFRGVDLRVLSQREIVQKVHSRFKDLKKDLRAGKKFVVDPQEEGGCGAKGQVRARTVRRAGCTSVKSTTVLDGEAIKKRRKGKARAGRDDNSEEDDCDDDDSFDSAVLESDGSDGDDAEEGGEGAPRGKASGRRARTEPVDEWKEFLVARRPDKRRQDEERRKRLQRRKASVQASRKARGAGRKKKRATSTSRTKPRAVLQEEECPPIAAVAHELSAYERLRLEKVKRNQERLEKLGLAGGFGSVSRTQQAATRFELQG